MSEINRAVDRYLPASPAIRQVAQQLYDGIADLPLICPHGHVDPQMFADPNYRFGSPTELILIPDHYIFRMLYSQGIELEALCIPRRDGGETGDDHRRAWQLFAENFYLFRGTPTGIWLQDELALVFGVTEKLNGRSAQTIYDQIDAQLKSPEFKPRALFERFNIEVLCTTDAATDTLVNHQAIRDSDWNGRILPTFRPDAVVNLDRADWHEQIAILSAVSGIDVVNYPSFIAALEQRRAFFKSMGAAATDHAALTAYTEGLTGSEAETIFQRALVGQASADDARRFTGHMLMEMARMSIEDGLVMQLHVGSYRNHNPQISSRFGPDMGADMPIRSEFTHNLAPLLQKYGNDPRLSLILFTLDETTYARELAPLAGHYPSVFLGPPWWFYDSVNGMVRYRDLVHETAGLYNTVGFNDDTRAYPSIPVRHDVWRRVESNWLAGLVVRGMIDMEDAAAMAADSAYGLVKRAYRF